MAASPPVPSGTLESFVSTAAVGTAHFMPLAINHNTSRH